MLDLTTKDSESEREKLRQQGDLVVKKLSKLADRYEAFCNDLENRHKSTTSPETDDSTMTSGLPFYLTTFLLDQLQFVSQDSCALIQQLKLSTKKYKGKIDVAGTRESLIGQTNELFEWIDKSIYWLRGSEFDLVQAFWPNEIRGFDEQLEVILAMMDPTIVLEQNTPLSRRRPLRLSEPAVELAKTVVPLIKLTRLFFNKLSERGMNRKRLPLFTTLCSYQLEIIGGVAGDIGCKLADILEILCKADEYDEEDTNEVVTKKLKEIESCFESSFLLILLHFVPIIPDTDGNPVQNYFKNWFATWNTQFTLAINNVLDASQAYQDSGQFT
ncbi:hypothetical protein PtA15_4A123 [Puccinia triticina]|uniref:Uncharacterized protein n=1 Tax=Puccinia triticina TaxID=208348 RepID=A0ABY7CIN4_9BASI|nr:uncharacterized protein PtA15_4A123 [Puccinia triticina]WAQ83675.1 hypothetical protein PtA15_4A123 [Puccinia triticina]